MRIQKNGENYKVKCNGAEYDILKYCLFQLFENKDDYMRDWVLEHRITDEDMEDMAYIMKGMD